MWTLEYGIELARKLGKECADYGYFVSLAGGVLHRGYSDHDVDIIFIPLTNAVQLREDLFIKLRNIMTEYKAPLVFDSRIVLRFKFDYEPFTNKSIINKPIDITILN